MADLGKYEKLFMFGLLSTVAIGMFLFAYVVFNDYFIVPMYSVTTGLQTSGALSSGWVTLFEFFSNRLSVIVTLADYLFLGAFVGMVYGLFRLSYKSERETYPTIFGLLLYGTLVLMFISSIFEIITKYFYNIFFNAILINLTPQLFFYDFYIANFGIINLIVIAGCILLNFADFGFLQYQQRKVGEIGETNKQQEL